MKTRTVAAVGVMIAAAAALFFMRHIGAAETTPFPDVPPWHWAHDAVQKSQDTGILIGYPASDTERVENALVQVYDGFAHAGAAGAQAWVERFTYNRPANWPRSLQQSRIVRFALRDMRVVVNSDTATATFAAVVATPQGKSVTPMRVTLRRGGQDWQVDYAGLAAGNALFR
jgi:hypothetical protein